MNPEFEIEYIFELKSRNKIYVFAKLLTPNSDWHLSDKSKLGDVEIEKSIDIPRKLDDDGNVRLNLFAFVLKNNNDRNKLKVNQIAELIP